MDTTEHIKITIHPSRGCENELGRYFLHQSYQAFPGDYKALVPSLLFPKISS